MEQKLSDLMPNVALDINELANIKGGEDTIEQEEKRACDTGACSSSIETLTPYCSEAVCRTGA